MSFWRLARPARKISLALRSSPAVLSAFAHAARLDIGIAVDSSPATRHGAEPRVLGMRPSPVATVRRNGVKSSRPHHRVPVATPAARPAGSPHPGRPATSGSAVPATAAAPTTPRRRLERRNGGGRPRHHRRGSPPRSLRTPARLLRRRSPARGDDRPPGPECAGAAQSPHSSAQRSRLRLRRQPRSPPALERRELRRRLLEVERYWIASVEVSVDTMSGRDARQHRARRRRPARRTSRGAERASDTVSGEASRNCPGGRS